MSSRTLSPLVPLPAGARLLSPHPVPSPVTPASKRKRPSPILTAQPSPDASAAPVPSASPPMEQDDEIGSATLSARARDRSDPAAVSQPDSSPEDGNERGGKLSRRSCGDDVTSGSPVVLAAADGEQLSFAATPVPSATGSPTAAAAAGVMSPPMFAHTHSHPPLLLVRPASSSVLGALSTRTSASVSLMNSAASSNLSTPAHSRTPHLPTWSPEEGSASASHLTPALASYALGAASSNSAMQLPQVPTTPPSNVPSPSCSPRRNPEEGSDGALQPLELDQPCGPDMQARRASTVSPSSSAAHSPTSTASQLRAAPQRMPNRLDLCASPAVSMVVAPSPAPLPPQPAQLPIAITLSPRCQQHSAAAGSPLRNTSGNSSKSSSKASTPRRSLPGSGGRESTGSGNNGARSPSPSPGRLPGRSPIPHSPMHAPGWVKPAFLQRLHVSIPEVSPPIASPVPLGAETPGSFARPSFAQTQKDAQHHGPARMLLLSPLVGAAGGGATFEPQSLAMLNAPVSQADGVACSGSHYSVSMLKGRRRNMEDTFLQATIDLSRPPRAVCTLAQSSHSDAHAAADTSAAEDIEAESDRPATPPANLFGIADGHGKQGAHVAQLTAQLLPVLLDHNLRKAIAAAGSTQTVNPSHATPRSQCEASKAAPMSPLQLKSASVSPAPAGLLTTSSATSLPPLHLSPAGSSMAGRPPRTPSVAIAAPTPATAASAPDDGMEKGARMDDASAAADPIAAAIQETFLQVDSHVLAGNHTGGTTCTTAYIHQPPPSESAVPTPATLYVASVGDSRAVLSRAGRAIALSSDHKPNRPDERARVEAAGGHVLFVSGWRVDGVLNISRALGDGNLKDESAPRSGRVVAVPELTKTQITDLDEFIICASDGVWGRLSNQQAVSIVRSVLLGAGSAAGEVVAAAGTEEEQDAAALSQLPPLPTLAHDHSYLHPSPSGHPIPSNPIVQTPAGRLAAVPETHAAEYGRDNSTESTASIRTILNQSSQEGAATATPLSAITGASVRGHSASVALNTSLSSTSSHPPVASPSPRPAAAARGFLSPALSGRAVLPSPGTMSLGSAHTRLTSPTAAMAIGGKQDSVQSRMANDLHTPGPLLSAAIRPDDNGATLAAAAGAAQEAAPAPSPTSATGPAASSSAPSTSLPCCWSSLEHRPEVVAAASEALIAHAFEQAQSMDNISAAVVLLYPWQPHTKQDEGMQYR
jgi:serine/threonine protein phosphatase PrpC